MGVGILYGTDLLSVEGLLTLRINISDICTKIWTLKLMQISCNYFNHKAYNQYSNHICLKQESLSFSESFIDLPPYSFNDEINKIVYQICINWLAFGHIKLYGSIKNKKYSELSHKRIASWFKVLLFEFGGIVKLCVQSLFWAVQT